MKRNNHNFPTTNAKCEQPTKHMDYDYIYLYEYNEYNIYE